MEARDGSVHCDGSRRSEEQHHQGERVAAMVNAESSQNGLASLAPRAGLDKPGHALYLDRVLSVSASTDDGGQLWLFE